MKYLYFSLLLFLTALSILNHTRINKAKSTIKMHYDIHNQVLNESKNYLTAITSQPYIQTDSRILLTSNDTLTLSDSTTKGLFYVFSQNDCMTCVEENIFTLIGYTKQTSTQNIYIISTKEKMRYLKQLARVHKYNFLKFGFLMDSVDIPASCYFKKYDSGMISNFYYPIKGEFTTTKKYLDNMNITLD